MGNILPHSSDTERPPTTGWMSRLDGCPACVTNTELPTGVGWTADGFLAHYHCTDCGHSWSTAWKD